MTKTMRGRGRRWLLWEDDGDKRRRKRKPHGEWLFARKKKEITWKNGKVKRNRKIIEKKKMKTNKNN